MTVSQTQRKACASITDQPRGPLVGYRVLEFCTTVAGPACARLLADFGADVIKVEAPGGDPIRSMGSHLGDESLYAATILRNKKSIVLDLKTREGLSIARRLAARCDVIVENFRPGTLEKLGLGYEELARENPGLVMVRISGYGQDGPYAHKPGYGTVCEAFAGVRNLTGDADRPPSRVGVALTDYLTAVYAALGATMALLERSKSGLGQVVDTALYEAAFSLLEPEVPAFDQLGVVACRHGSSFPGLVPNNLYPTQDGGHILIAANNDVIFARLCKVMGRGALATDPRFDSIRSRAMHAKEIDAEVTRWTMSKSGRGLLADLEGASVPTSLLYTVKDAFADPQYMAREAIVRVPHPALGHVAMTGLVPRLSRTPGGIHRSGPAVGADTDLVLQSILKLGPEAIEQLKAAGATGMKARTTGQA